MSNELLIPKTLTSGDVYANNDNPNHHLDLIKLVTENAEALTVGIDLDMNLKEHREIVKSTAYKVSRSKTALDNLGKELTENARKTINAVNEKRKRIRDDLDTVRDKVRAPLNEWESAEEKRISLLQKRLENLEKYTTMQMSQYTSEQIAEHIEKATELARFDWQEFRDSAQAQWVRTNAHLNKIFEERKTYEAEQDELEKLRKEQAEKNAELEQLRREKAEREASESAAPAKMPPPPPEFITTEEEAQTATQIEKIKNTDFDTQRTQDTQNQESATRGAISHKQSLVISSDIFTRLKPHGSVEYQKGFYDALEAVKMEAEILHAVA